MLEIKGAQPDNILQVLYREYYPESEFEPIKSAAIDGKLTILQVFWEKVLIGYLVAREDVLFGGKKELAVIRAMACVKGKNPIAHVLAHGLSRFALSHGFDSVRIHSDRRGMDAFLEEAGFEFQESVFTKDLSHGK